jgi:hypothetical protein
MSYSDSLEKVSELINGLMIVLSEKEKYIIENRFSLNDNPRQTLEKIGQKYNVTRERIRQIEKNALRKLERNVNNTDLYYVTDLAVKLIDNFGGVVSERRMVEEMKVKGECLNTDEESLKLTIDLEKELERVHNTIQYKPHWRKKGIKGAHIKKVCAAGYKLLKKKKEVMTKGEITSAIINEVKIEGFALTPEFVISSLDLDRRLLVLGNKSVGLSSWRHINPKTLRDKIFYVMREMEKPMHYVEISEKIEKLPFDEKKINTQAVHNELIRFDGFVLIGRGIYALSEWGYKEGTVADVIESILKNETEPLSRNEIVAKVLERRQVKRITILLNLKNKPQFERVGQDKYQLAK